LNQHLIGDVDAIRDARDAKMGRRKKCLETGRDEKSSSAAYEAESD
jgi:hypothetical protein